MKSLEYYTKRISFEFPDDCNWLDNVPCISVFGNIVTGKVVLWVHNKRVEIKNSDILSTKILILFNAHAYDFVKYIEELKEKWKTGS